MLGSSRPCASLESGASARLVLHHFHKHQQSTDEYRVTERLGACIRIAATPAIEPDRGELAEHLCRVAYGMNPAAGHVVPGDQHLADAVAAQARDVEQLDVEAPALDGQMREEIERGLAPQALEA